MVSAKKIEIMLIPMEFNYYLIKFLCFQNNKSASDFINFMIHI